jgi:hypothetical protein
MKAKIETFLLFCDVNHLGFEIKFRNNFEEDGRFFLTFGSYHKVKIMGAVDEREYSFANGSTPNEALERCILDLKGSCLQFRRIKDGEHTTCYAVFNG